MRDPRDPQRADSNVTISNGAVTITILRLGVTISGPEGLCMYAELKSTVFRPIQVGYYFTYYSIPAGIAADKECAAGL